MMTREPQVSVHRTDANLGHTSTRREVSGSRGGLALDFAEPECWGLRSATDAIALPKPEPRAMGEFLVMRSVRGCEIAGAERSGVRHGEDTLELLDLGNGAIGVHRSSII